MGFFNQNISNQNEEENINSNGKELEFNKKNRVDYENLMRDSSTQLDGYWDSNNPFVKVLLLILGIIIVVGSIFYILAYLGQ
jgi:hypothetical protein